MAAARLAAVISVLVASRPRIFRLLPRQLAATSMLLLGASCVPYGPAARPLAASTVAPAVAVPIKQLAAASTLAPQNLVALAPADAFAANAAIPVSVGPNPAAAAFFLRARSMSDELRSLQCLTAAIYYEAASESDDGQRAVAQVVLNRMRHPAYPNSVCGVVFQGSARATGCQFTFTCDGALGRTPSTAGWMRARRVASAALAGTVYAPVGQATHYHTRAVHPYWASSLVKAADVGAHIFYRLTGSWGRPAAFRQAYAGTEPVVSFAPRRAAVASPLLAASLASFGTPAKSRHEAATPLPLDNLPQVRLTSRGLPESRIKEAYRNAGALREPAQASAVLALK